MFPWIWRTVAQLTLMCTMSKLLGASLVYILCYMWSFVLKLLPEHDVHKASWSLWYWDHPHLDHKQHQNTDLLFDNNAFVTRIDIHGTYIYVYTGNGNVVTDEWTDKLPNSEHLLRSARKKSIQSVADDDELLNAKPELAVNVGKTSMLINYRLSI